MHGRGDDESWHEEGRWVELAPYMIEQDWLGSYQSYAGVDRAVRRMSTRLSKNGDVMRAALDDLDNPAVPTSVVARKALRIARLRNDWNALLWLHTELRPAGDQQARLS